MYIILLAQSWTPDTLQQIMPGSLQAGLSGTMPFTSVRTYILTTQTESDLSRSEQISKTGLCCPPPVWLQIMTMRCRQVQSTVLSQA